MRCVAEGCHAWCHASYHACRVPCKLPCRVSCVVWLKSTALKWEWMDGFVGHLDVYMLVMHGVFTWLF